MRRYIIIAAFLTSAAAAPQPYLCTLCSSGRVCGARDFEGMLSNGVCVETCDECDGTCQTCSPEVCARSGLEPEFCLAPAGCCGGNRTTCGNNGRCCRRLYAACISDEQCCGDAACLQVAQLFPFKICLERPPEEPRQKSELNAERGIRMKPSSSGEQTNSLMDGAANLRVDTRTFSTPTNGAQGQHIADGSHCSELAESIEKASGRDGRGRYPSWWSSFVDAEPYSSQNSGDGVAGSRPEPRFHAHLGAQLMQWDGESLLSSIRFDSPNSAMEITGQAHMPVSVSARQDMAIAPISAVIDWRAAADEKVSRSKQSERVHYAGSGAVLATRQTTSEFSQRQPCTKDFQLPLGLVGPQETALPKEMLFDQDSRESVFDGRAIEMRLNFKQTPQYLAWRHRHPAVQIDLG